MTWNHRLVKTADCIGVYEVYYKASEQPYAYSQFNIVGETLEGCVIEYQRIKSAFEKPVLNYPEDFSEESYDK